MVGSATPRSEAVSEFTRVLAGPAAFLHHAQPLPARAAILYNRQALVLGSIDSGDRVMLSLLGCHRALCERQIPVDFVNEEELCRGAASRYAALYLPYSYAMDDRTMAAVRQYVAEGGTLWADGPVAWKNDYGQVRPDFLGELSDVFGVKVTDILPVEGPFALTPRAARAGDEMRLPLVPCGAEVLVKDAKGLPVSTRHRYGHGTAYYIGTALTLGYHRHADPQAGEWIAGPARANTRGMRVCASTDAQRLFFRPMQCPDGLVAILTNPGAECRVKVTFHGRVREIEDVLTKRCFKAAFRNASSEIEVMVPAGAVSVLHAKVGSIEPKAKGAD